MGYPFPYLSHKQHQKVNDMLYYKIKNYEDFKNRFGTETREPEVSSRKTGYCSGI